MPDKPKEMTNDDIVTCLKEDIRAAETVADTESQENAKLYKYYRAKTMDNEVEGRSKIVDTSVFETVEWIMPALEDIFSVENGIPEMEPQGPEDVGPAEMMTELCRYQFWRQSDTVRTLRAALKKSLLFRPGGIIKYCWEKDVSKERTQYAGLAGEDLLTLAATRGASIDYLTPKGEDAYDAEVTWTDVEYDGPRFYSVPDGEFLRHPNCRDIRTSPFIAHKYRITADELRRRAKNNPSEWFDVEKAIEEYEGGESFPETYTENVMMGQDDLSRDKEPSSDPARREMKMYECYVRMDTDGDGLLESRMMCLLGERLVRNHINKYRFPPFVKLASIDDIDKFSGIPISEMVMDIQRLRTFLLRQMVDNQAQVGNSRKVFDPMKINQADLEMNVPGAPIRTKPGVDVRTALLELVTQPFSPSAFSLLEYVTNLAEQRTGVTKTSKGVGDQYNETFHGQMASLNQASQRIRMIAKIIATGLEELFRAMIFMNKTFLTETTFVRLMEDKFLEIAPDDLEGRMDLVIHVIMGQSSRQQTMINMQTLLATLGQLQANTGMPVLDASNTANIIREFVKSMGYKAQDRFLPLMFQQDAKMANQQMMQMMAMQALMGGSSGGGGGTIGSTAGTGAGAVATSNPGGAGLPSPAVQPGSGGILPAA